MTTFKARQEPDGSWSVDPSGGVLPDGTTWSAKFVSHTASAPRPSIKDVAVAGDPAWPSTFQHSPTADVCAKLLMAAGRNPSDQMPTNGWPVLLHRISQLLAERDQLARLMAGEPLLLPCTCPPAHHQPACGRSARAAEAVPEATVGPCGVCLDLALADGCTCPGCGAEGKPLPEPAPTKPMKRRPRDGKGGLVCNPCGARPVRTHIADVTLQLLRSLHPVSHADVLRVVEAYASIVSLGSHRDEYLVCACGRIYAPAFYLGVARRGDHLLDDEHTLTPTLVMTALGRP